MAEQPQQSQDAQQEPKPDVDAGAQKLEPEQFRKIFVGSIPTSATDDMVRDFYAAFGTITDLIVMHDPATGRSRGFGFITYGSKQMVDAAMAARPHVIDGKTVDPKRAVPRDEKNRSETNISTARLYVSGVREDHTEQILADYFGQFGNVLKSDIILDKLTNKPRGFAFVTFDDYDAVDKCVLIRSHNIGNHRCNVRKYLENNEMAKAQMLRDKYGQQDRFREMGPRRDYNPPETEWGPPSRGHAGYMSFNGSSCNYNQGYKNVPVQNYDAAYADAYNYRDRPPQPRNWQGQLPLNYWNQPTTPGSWRSGAQTHWYSAPVSLPRPEMLSPQPATPAPNCLQPVGDSPMSICSNNSMAKIPFSVVAPVKTTETRPNLPRLNPEEIAASSQCLKRLALEMEVIPEKRHKISSILNKVHQNTLTTLLNKLQNHSLENAKVDIVCFLEQLEPYLAMRETRIKWLTESLAESIAEVEKLKVQVKERDSRIEAHETVIQENISNLQKADKELKMSDKTIRLQWERNLDNDTRIKILQKELQERDDVIQEIKVVFEMEKNELLEKYANEESRISSLESQNLAEMNQLREKVKEQTAAMELKDAEFKKMEVRMSKREELLRSQQDAYEKDLGLARLVSTTSRGIPELERMIKELKATNSKQKTIIEEKKQEIAEMETKLKMNNDKINSQILEMAKLSQKAQKQPDAKPQALETELKKKDEKLAELQAKLTKLQKEGKKKDRPVEKENHKDVASLLEEIEGMKRAMVEGQNRIMLQEALLKSQDETIAMMKNMVEQKKRELENSDESENEN